MHRSLQTRMRNGMIVCALVFIAVRILMAADPAVMESTEALEDVAPSTDATSPFWRGARLVYAHATVLRSAPAGQTRICISYSFDLTKR